MKIAKLGCSLVAAVAFGGLFESSPTWADSMDCSGTKTSKERPYTEIIRPGDRPDHEMRQAIRTHVISSKNADFDGSEQTVYAHEDSYAYAASGIDGISTPQSGTSVGYFLYTLKNGEKIWAKFDSVYSTSSGAPAYSTTSTQTQSSWEVTYQGVFHFVGGTGKYAGIRGGGHYKGKVTPSAGFEENSVCSAQY